MGNEERAGRAYQALMDSNFYEMDDGLREGIMDLIVDLLHLAQQEGFAIDDLLAMAKIHFEDEQEGG